MKQLLNDLKSMREALREEYEKPKKRPLGLDEHKALQASWELVDEMLAGAEKAVEKQIPKKPNITLRGTTGWNTEAYCPACKTMVHSNYCSECGQAIKWESE